MRQLLHQFDSSIIQHIAGWPSWLHGFFLVVTFIGQPVITIGVCVALAAIAFKDVNQRLLIATIVAIGTMGIGSIIKVALQRERPLTEYASHMLFKSFSFPSGHTLGSTLAFGLLAYLLWNYLPEPWGVIAAVLLVLLIIAVGLSRISLGAHFPSDVLAGWLIGLVGLALIIFIVRPQL